MGELSILDLLELILSSGSIITLAIFLIQRHDARKDENKKVLEKLEELHTESIAQDIELEKKLRKLEKDIVRTQLLQLMQDYDSDDEFELMQVAEHYFSKEHLAANWYMTTKFNRFLKKNNIAKPEWLDK